MWDARPRTNKCTVPECGRNQLNDYEYCNACLTLIKCELPTCEEWVTAETTCPKHSRMLRQLGQEPQQLVGANQQLRGPMDNNDFRMSASYASRYNNCHGSANLAEAIPGFVHPERNDNGMKGEGTRLHKIFELSVSGGRLREAAALLTEISTLWGPKRTAYLEQDEVAYLTNYFLKYKVAPPLEIADLKDCLLSYKPVLDEDGNPKKAPDGTELVVAAGTPPRRIQFVAEALNYVQDILDEMDADTLEVIVEAKKTVEWLKTTPKTTVDLVIKDKSTMHVIDLKMGEIEVSPIMNEQLMYYAKTFGADDYDTVKLHILQRQFTDDWILTPEVLDKWASEVQESEQAILDGDLRLSPGTHCTFCPANPHGRGDRGNKACPAMMTVLYGERDEAEADAAVLEDD